MSNKGESGNGWLASRLIFDASLVVGMLGFAASLWGISGLKQLGVAIVSGVVCAAISFVVLYSVNRLVQLVAIKVRDSRDAQEQNTDERAFEPKRIQGNEFGADLINEDSMSLNSLREDERTVISGFKPKRNPPFPTQWSVELIETLDWQVFDNLCVAFWKMKGNSVVNRSEGSISGTQFFLTAPQNKSHPLGLVEARSAQSTTVSAVEMQNFFKHQKDNNLPLGVLMYAGKISNVVASFCHRKKIRLIGADNIYKGLSALTDKQRKKLLQSLIRPDYMVPTCPNCKIKLVKRMRKDTRRLFWGCISYPECRFNMGYIAPH